MTITAPAAVSDAEVFENSVARLADILDRHLWPHIAAQAQAEIAPATRNWKNCFCALVLTLNPDSRVTDALESLPPTPDFLDETALLNAMGNMGHFARRMDGTAETIDPRFVPCLCVPKDGRIPPFVITGKNEDGVQVYSPDTETITRLHPADPRLAAAATIWIFQPFDRQRQRLSRFMRQGTGQSWFRALLSRFAPTLRQIFLIGFFLNIVVLAPPLYMMAVYDRVISPSAGEALTALTAGVVIALIAEYMLRRTRSRALSWLSARLDTLVGTEIFAHLLGLSPQVGEKVSVAAQIARIKTFESIRDLFSGAIFLSFLEIPYVVLAIGLIAWIAGPLAIVPALASVAFALLFYTSWRRVRILIRLAAKASSARQQFTLETFEKLPGIHANGLPPLWRRKYADLSGREIMSNFHLSWIGTMAETLGHALTLFAAVATVGYGVHLVWAGAMGTGALIASMMLVWRVLSPFYSLCAMVARLEQLRNSIQQVNDLIDIETEEEANLGAARLLDIRGDVTLDAVTMSYQNDMSPVLKEATLHIRNGECLAITGRSGSGKSTILKLIKSMHKPQHGALRIDGFDLRQLDPVHLRRHIGYVGQQAEFFSGTVLENLRFARPLAEEKEIIHALTLADAWDEVRDLPEGLHNRIDPARLPENLAAKLSLARGYLHNGRILLIDELPAGVLHGRAGQILARYIAHERGKRTIIFVSQHQPLLALADSVIDIVDGAPRYLQKPDLPNTPAGGEESDDTISYFTPKEEARV